MKATDVVGWVDVEGQEIYCANCTPSNEYAPIFADTVTDCPNHCSTCSELLDQNFTDACVEYMCNKLTAWLVKGQGKKEIIEQWATALDKVQLGNIEQTIVDLTLQRVKYLDDQPKAAT